MKILHTADWHIGSFKGPEKEGVNLRSEDTMKCLRSLVETAEKEKPDLVLVSGDIFHQAEIWQGRSHKEVLQAREIILALSRAAGQVIVMRGTPNHDSEEAFLELKAHFEFIDNVKIVITPELVRTSYADIVAVPGFDKGTFRAQHPGISKEDENIVFSEELGKIVVGMRAMCSGDVPAILMSHYTVPGCNTESGQTQFLTQFEPVITQDMLLAADYDLVALGHIHRPQMINGLRNVYYSGAVNAMNFNDEGQDRGFWLYEMKRFSNEKWDISDAWFRKTPYREFITFHFTDTDITAINLGHIEEVAFNYWTYNGAVADKIVRVLYTCSAEQKKIFNTALLEKALYEAGAFWVAGIEAEKIESANRTELSKQEDPETNLIQYLQEKLIEPKKIDSIVEKARPIIAKAKANSAVSEFFGTFVPKEIEVKNYRNYVEQYFSFEDISFCTINGSNGSGKSSLFMDAIVDCLYEEPREGTNTGWIRNDEKARSGSISFTFGLGDKMFRVVRTRTKSGKPTLNLSELLENEWVDRSKEKIADTQKEIIRLLGMDSLTFKACVLIMQDQYGLFLEAGKEERVGVLSNLLGLGIYGIMEDLAKDELGNLKRDIAKKRQTINIHSATIESYGKPEDEKTEIELKLNTVSEDRNNLAKQKEDKSLLLRMQMEAQERHDKVQASVNTLMQKNEQEGQNIAALERNIESCNAFLADEEETNLKVERHDLLLEQDREYAKAAVAYMGKHEELVRIHNQEMSEEQNISRLKTELQGKQDEKNEMILDSANDGEVRQKAGEYEQAKNNNYGKDASEGGYKAIPAPGVNDSRRTARVLTGTGPVSWSHDGTLEGIWDLNGNIWEWNGGSRTVKGELQVLVNNNAADLDHSQAASSAQWKAIDATTGAYITPNGSGTTANSIKLDWVSGKITYSATITTQADASRDCAFASVTCASSVSAAAQAVLKALAFLPASATASEYEDDHMWMNNGADERAFYSGGYWGYGAIAGLFALGGGGPRSNSGWNLGFRSAYVDLPTE